MDLLHELVIDQQEGAFSNCFLQIDDIIVNPSKPAPGMRSRKRTVSPSPCSCNAAVDSKRRRICKERVGFADAQKKVRLFHLYPLGASEEDCELLRNNIWYTKQEYNHISATRQETVKRACSGEILDLRQFSTRGLEPYLSPSLSSEMLAHRSMHHKTVLRECQRQQRAQEFSARRIAQKVSTISSWSLQRAQMQAKKDAQDASDYQSENTAPNTRSSECTSPTTFCTSVPVPVSPTLGSRTKNSRRRSKSERLHVNKALTAYNAHLLNLISPTRNPAVPLIPE